MVHPSHRLLTSAVCHAQDPYSGPHNAGTCNICDGGLAYCVFCKGGESELDTPCPSPLATLKAMLRCPGIDTTDQETGSTFRDMIIDAITKATAGF